MCLLHYEDPGFLTVVIFLPKVEHDHTHIPTVVTINHTSCSHDKMTESQSNHVAMALQMVQSRHTYLQCQGDASMTNLNVVLLNKEKTAEKKT